MELVILFALAGGLFSVLTFIHFVVDWIFQTHAEAMAKHNNAKVRARHCLIYTLGFVPLLSVFTYIGALTLLEFVICLVILFVSHFIEDTYLPVLYWALYVRRPPEMLWNIKLESGVGKLYDPDGVFDPSGQLSKYDITVNNWRWELACSVKNDETCKVANKQLVVRGFMEFVSGSLGKILMIAIDQIIHLAFLVPIVWMVLRNFWR